LFVQHSPFVMQETLGPLQITGGAQTPLVEHTPEQHGVCDRVQA
jgi:hypothetical protein